MKQKNVNKFFPIPTQTSLTDRIVLLKVMNLMGKKKKNYKYLEIGSFLGGSLAPFLIDKNCKKILSIDKRNQVLNDERNEQWSYKNITQNKMLQTLKNYNFNLNKIKAYDGDISEFKIKENFDLTFIDGIHTDKNVFSDFLYALDLMNKNSIILFHDSNVIFKSISLISIFLKKKNYSFKVLKFKDSLITGIFLGKFSKIRFENKRTEKFENFLNLASERLLIHQLNNRIKVKFKISRFLKGKPSYKFFIKPIQKKNV